jgi:hypothetical protein
MLLIVELEPLGTAKVPAGYLLKVLSLLFVQVSPPVQYIDRLGNIALVVHRCIAGRIGIR